MPCPPAFLFSDSRMLPPLPPFPTRRSSDLGGRLGPFPDLSGTAVPNGTGDATGEAARVASTLVPMTAETSASGATAPRPAHRPTERTFHGDTVVDPYEWLRDKTDPEVIAHLEAENAYADAGTAHLDDLRTALV